MEVTGGFERGEGYLGFFFFQAEDGIRDIGVTGVQTCAFFVSSRRRHARYWRDWSSHVCSSDLDAYSVFYLPSVSVLPHIHARVKTGGSQALVLANDQEEGLPRLSYAEGEARAVASLWGSQPLLGEAATASMLRSKAGDYEIVHLIAHFDFDSQHPQSSRIILGRAKGNDGPLELNDVFGLDLRKTNLVVLSGCQSQRGNRTRGDDVIGLSRAFISAGSPSVIGRLWTVDDDATQQLMIAFYTHLKEGLSKAEALRSAQVDIRHKYPNHYYWAGFVLT